MVNDVNGSPTPKTRTPLQRIESDSHTAMMRANSAPALNDGPEVYHHVQVELRKKKEVHCAKPAKQPKRFTTSVKLKAGPIVRN